MSNPRATTTDPQRDAIIERIRKLAKMTIANGCSEAEAEIALRKLEALRQEYNVTRSEEQLKLDADGMIEDIFIVPTGNEGANWTKYLNEVIKLHEVRIYFSRDTDTELLGFPIPIVTIHIFGYPIDVSAAQATIQIVQVAMKSAALRYKPNMKATEKTAFQDGFAERINERLADMRRNRELASVNRKADGQQLVVLKDKLVAQHYREHLRTKGVNLGSADYARTHGNAKGAGRVAANDVNLGGSAIGGGPRRLSNV